MFYNVIIITSIARFNIHLFNTYNDYTKMHVQKYKNFQYCIILHCYFKLLNIMIKYTYYDENHFKLRRSIFRRSILTHSCSAILIIYIKRYFIYTALFLLSLYYCIFFLQLLIDLFY